MIAKREKAITENAPEPIRLFDFLTECEDPTNADEALLILGIACRDPKHSEQKPGERERLLLEPWAVEAALSRRAASKLGNPEIDEAQRCTRDAGSIRWPQPATT